MNLKKYILYSGISTWAIILLIAVVGAFVHQVKFQDSHKQIYMQLSIDNLKADLDKRNAQLEYMKYINDYYYKFNLELLNNPYKEYENG